MRIYRPNRAALALLLISVCPALAISFFHPRRPDWSRRAVPLVDVVEANATKTPTLWLDIRSASEFQVVHVPDAINFDLGERWDNGLQVIVKSWRPGQRIVVYCEDAKCTSSSDVARRLRKDLGTSEIYVLRGGWQAWKEARR